MKGHNGVAARGVPQGSFQEWTRHNHMAFRLPHSGIKFGEGRIICGGCNWELFGRWPAEMCRAGTGKY
jgi:hypothetical protein